MSLKLIKKTQVQIDSEVAESKIATIAGGRGKYSHEICPYVIKDDKGQKSDVWDLSENQICGLIKTVATNWGKGKDHALDLKNFTVVGNIFKCWIEKHHEANAQFAFNYCKLTDVLSGAQREVVRDLVGDYCSTKINEAKAIATYISGGNTKVSSAQIMQVLQNQVQMAEQNQAREI